GIEVLAGHAVTGTSGRLRISAMAVEPKGGGAVRVVPVDALLTSSGWTPAVHLFSQSRGKVSFDDATQRFLPGDYAQAAVSVGSCNGTDDLAAVIEEAAVAGERAARVAAVKSPPPLTPPHT